MESNFVQCNSTNVPKVDFDMVYEFLKKQTAGGAAGPPKEQRSARPNYGDKAIGYVQLKRDGSLCTIKAKITPEHRLGEKAYNVVCVINEEKDKEEILQADCESCPASQGGCKHRVAFVMWLHRRFEEPSPTEVTSYWKKSVLSSSGRNPIPISSLCPREEEYPVPTDFQAAEFKLQVQHEITHGVAGSTISPCEFVDVHKVAQGCASFDTLSDKLKRFLTNEEISKIEILTRGQSTCPEWHLVHYGRVTASKFYDVAHCKVEGSLLNSILGEKIKVSKQMKRGIDLEDKVFQLVKKKLTDVRKCGIFLSEKYPLFGASPDGIGLDYVVEIKCPQIKQQKII
ncbi:hypothetical protein WDU94_003678 [Cyamophila willieti]